MSVILVIVTAVAAVVLFDIAAVRWGVDSRDESPDHRRSQYPTGIAAH